MIIKTKTSHNEDNDNYHVHDHVSFKMYPIVYHFSLLLQVQKRFHVITSNYKIQYSNTYNYIHIVNGIRLAPIISIKNEVLK